jgi:hypothetical protein
MATRLPLSEVVSQVAAELVRARDRARQRGEAVMQFDECELEFAVEAEKEASGGVNVWAIELGAGVKRTEANVVRVKFKALSSNPIQAEQRSDDDMLGPELRKQL